MHPMLKKLRELALSLPETREDFPWGDCAWKVGKKAFVFSGVAKDGSVGISVKLVSSHRAALKMPFVKPTGYNLGKSGWVSVNLNTADKVPLPLLKEWVIESYCAIAPKKLVATLGK